ncbi:MAG: glutamate--tRNA ligase [Clostridia bacterium]|jgi:glutamyl-tRNA synthetase
MKEKRVRTRYAPSPTGSMHIGNLRSALYEYLIAKSQGGDFILRIEDTDQSRLVEGAIEKIYDTLKLAGIQHDEGPDVGGDYGPYVQSQRKDLYLPYALELVEKKQAYYCFCDKERLEELRKSQGHEGVKYDRHCLSLSDEEIKANLEAKVPFVIRQKMPQEGSVTYEDAVFGTITVPCSELEDQILIKSDGFPTYNFANVIDDHLMKITHVVRGSEYVSSTPKYILLYEAFGWDVPVFVHLPLITKEGGRKMSKREGDASFMDLVEKGYLPEAIVNYVALLGWSPRDNREIFSLQELAEAFDISGISKSPSVFDMEKLNWMNREYIRKLDMDSFHAKALPWYEKAGLYETNIDLSKVSKLLIERVEYFEQIPEMVDFLIKMPEDYDLNMFAHKKMKTTVENSVGFLEESLKALEPIEDWNVQTIEQALMDTVQRLGVKNGQILWPVRTAISGKQSTPGGAFEIADLLGKEETLSRMRISLNRLKNL